MHVLALSTSFPRNPEDHAGRFVFDLHAGLTLEGCRVTTLCPAAPGVAEHETGPAGDVVRLRYGTEEAQDLFYGSGLEANWRRVRAPIRKFRRFTRAALSALRVHAREADLVVGHWLWPGARICTRAVKDLPILGIAHGGDTHLLERPFFGRFMGQMLGARLHGVLATSSVGAEIARRRLGLDRARILVRPMGIETRMFSSPGKTPADWPEGYLLGVGRLVPVKGFDLLIEAAAKLGRPVVLIGDGPERPDLERRARDAHVSVLFTGFQPSSVVAAALAASAAVVIPSRRLPDGRVEGCPVIAVEALAAGARLVASSTGGLPDLVAPEFLFPSDDVIALTETTERALESPPPPAPLGLDRRDTARALLSLL